MRLVIVLAVVMASFVVPAPAQGSTLHWHRCPDGSALAAVAAAQCAQVQVPMDHARPNGPAFTVGVSRIPATDPGRRLGTLFANPGGPGTGTLDFWTRPMPAQLSARFDRIAVEPRGLRWSTPLDCRAPGKPDRMPQAFPALPDRLACQARQPGYIDTITTEATARDLDLVRQALGENKINLLGYSAGTNLFGVYATLFGAHVDKLVLDSGVDPAGIWSGHYRQVMLAWEHRLNDMFDWIAANHADYGLGATRGAVSEVWSGQVAAQGGGLLANLGGRASESGGDIERRLANLARSLRNPGVSTGVTFNATYTALYSRAHWPLLAQGLREYPGDRRFLDYLARRAPVGGVPGAWVFEATVCNEDRSARPELLGGALQAWAGGASSFEALSNVQGAGFACLGWPATVTAIRPDGGALAVRPLLIQSERDPATPAPGGFALATAMGAQVVRVAGGDHGHFGQGDPGLDAAVLRYLETGTVPIAAASERPMTTPSPPSRLPG